MADIAQDENVAQKTTDKELNFRLQEQKFQRQIAEIQAERDKLAHELEQKRSQATLQAQDDDEDDEPYIDKKKLNKSLAKHNQATQGEIQKAMQYAKEAAKEELKQELWLENNSDFYKIMELAETFAQKAPKLAENILRMPDGFERQKLVYNNIKALGLDQPEAKAPSIQDKIDSNRRSPFYSPSGIGTAPYANAPNNSPEGQKAAYDKVRQARENLRL